jgi:hypothetical protein
MVEQKIFDRISHHNSAALAQRSSDLYQHQQRDWPLLREGVAALNDIRVRTVQCGSYSVRLQYNPKRIVSTGAKVDSQSIRERKCFLCTENLPPQQQGVLYHETFLVLCNPMPIFPEHFTISNIRHIPQAIEDFIPSLLDLAKDFSSTHTIFYNGPRCGASAPDHMHFQASPKNVIPVEQDVEEEDRRSVAMHIGNVDVIRLEGYGREVILLESKEQQEIESSLKRLIAAMRKVLGVTDEPMMNILCSFTGGLWRMIVFPRMKHRPDVYFNEGDEKILISPASVDIGGLIVTPMEKDFLRVDAAMIESIFGEVSISRQHTQTIFSLLQDLQV